MKQCIMCASTMHMTTNEDNLGEGIEYIRFPQVCDVKQARRQVR